MEQYQEEFANILATNNILFFEEGLMLKDGRPSPYFVNMGVFGEKASLTETMGKYYAAMIKEQIDKGLKIDLIFGPAYKGMPIALATGYALWQKYEIDLGIVFDRKEIKTYGEGSNAKSTLVGAKLFDGCNIFMVDDVAASAATKYTAIEKLQDVAKGEGISINIVGLVLAVDREQTTALYQDSNDISTVKLGVKGTNALGEFAEKTNVPVFSVVKIRPVIEYLYENKFPVLINKESQAIPSNIKQKFDAYMDMYGV